MTNKELLKQAIEKRQEEVKNKETFKDVAILLKTFFDELVKNGFTSHQALELTKTYFIQQMNGTNNK